MKLLLLFLLPVLFGSFTVYAHSRLQSLRQIAKAAPQISIESSFKVPGTLPKAPKLLPPGRVCIHVNHLPVFAHDAHSQSPTASTAKILTAYGVLLDPSLPLSRMLTVTAPEVAVEAKGWAQNDVEIPLNVGDQISVKDLLYGMLLPSADDAAYILADHSARGYRGFLHYLNDLAKALGLTGTHLADASGLSPHDVSTAADLTHLTDVALQNPEFAKIVDTRYHYIPVENIGRIGNINWMLWNVKGDVGVKTGWTSRAHFSVVFAARRSVGNSRVLVTGAILGNKPSFTPTFHEARALVNYAFQTAAPVTIPAHQRLGVAAFALGGIQKPVYLQTPLQLMAVKGDTLTLTVKALAPTKTAAGEHIGTLTVSDRGVTLATAPLYTSDLPAPKTLLWHGVGKFLDLGSAP